MPFKIKHPTTIEAAESKFKRIEEIVGRINSKTAEVSIARVVCPPGRKEPGQTADFVECTIVLKGELQVETRSEVINVYPGEAIVVNPGEWVQFSTPGEDGAEYYAICVPAFSQDSVHRDE